MKIRGRKIEGPNYEEIIIPRGGDVPDIYLIAKAVLDTSSFDKLCPEPEPPSRIERGGQRVYDFDDKDYRNAVEARLEKHMAFMLLQSLTHPENELEWETVKLDDHRTWLNYSKELKDSGFSDMEIRRIEAGVYAANCLSERRLEEARANFQRTKAAARNALSGPLTELLNTSSGKPASVGESSLQDLSIAPALGGTN